MTQVLCNSIGSTHLCGECGAAKPHYHLGCEPCPINKEAHCYPVSNCCSALMVAQYSENSNIDFIYCTKCEEHLDGYGDIIIGEKERRKNV